MAGVELLAELHETLHERGIDFRLAETHCDVRNSLRRAGFEKFHVPILPDQTVEAILKKIPLMNPHILAKLAILALSAAPVSADIIFGPLIAGSGKSVRLVSSSASEGGTIRMEKDGAVNNGTILFNRERDLTWTIREPEADGTLRGMLAVAKIATSTTVTINGTPEKTTDHSPLAGKMVAMSKAPGGDWKFQLDGSVPMHRIDKEITELKLYLNRKWYPQRRVTLGESWEFDPAWIRMLIERDLENAQTIGTMRLRQIRKTAGKDTAVIDVSVRSTGGDFRPDGTATNAQIELNGQIVVNLKTMLDESLELSGTVVTRIDKPGDKKTVTLPLRISVAKTLVGN